MSKHDNIAAPKAETAATTSSQSRILARQLARTLTAEEIDVVSGAMRRAAGGTCSAGTCCTPDCDD